MRLTLPMSHYIFAVIFCAVLSLWILQQWIRKEVQALAEIINPLQVLKVLISAKQNSASILLWARRGDQSEIHSLWNWFAKPASKPLHTLSGFLFFPAKVNNGVVSSLAFRTESHASSQKVQLLLPNQGCITRWAGKLAKGSLDNTNLDNTPEICERPQNVVLVCSAGNRTHSCRTGVLGVMVFFQPPNRLEHLNICGICPVTLTGRSVWLVIAGVI